MLRTSFVAVSAALLILAFTGCEARKETPPAPAPKPAPGAAGEKATSELEPAPQPPAVAPATEMAAKPAERAPALAPAQQPAAPLPSGVTRRPFDEPLPPQLFELPSGALAVWRSYAAAKPALVLFSNHPMLSRLPEETREEARKLVLTGSAEEIARRGRFETPDTAFLPVHATSLAIDTGLFSEIVYVHPTTKSVEEFTLESFRSRAVAAGFLTEEESAGLSMQDGVIRGTLRGLPFRCVHPQSLPKLSGPVIVHIDLGYFKEIYVNAIKTPLYDLFYQLAASIRSAGWQAQAVTLSYSNQEAGMALATRFLISNLAEVLRQPALLEGGTPESWTERANALYMEAMFNEGKAREHVAQGAKSNPDDPAALYALAVTKFQTKHAKEGFATLDRAVRLDKGYGLEYVTLARQGLDIGQPKKAAELIGKAVKTFPQNPFMRLEQADILIRTGRGQEALPVLAELNKLPWSVTFHPDIPDLLKKMDEAAKAPPAPLPPAAAKPARSGQHPAHMGIPYH